MSRLNTSLESEGAEFLVLGNLLVEGVEAHKLYTNFPGYDVVAVNPRTNKNCRIQVKCRWATDFDGGFPIRNFDCDFVVFVALNRGYRYRRKATGEDDGRREPRFYVLPAEVLRKAHDARKARKPDDKWGKVFLKDIDDLDLYLSDWRAIKAFPEPAES
jgi:hypothetical protein